LENKVKNLDKVVMVVVVVAGDRRCGVQVQAIMPEEQGNDYKNEKGGDWG
jgi:hypothetical protein